MEKIAQIIAQSSFELWQSDNFREVIDFENISQTEQDRIFNELEVSALGLFILNFDYLEKDIRKAFLGLMGKVGIQNEFLKVWEELIKLRLKEYAEDYQLAIDQTGTFKELEEKNLRIIWSRVETITIDCLTHIRRGEVKKEDPSWKMLRGHFTVLDVVFSKLVDSSSEKITPAKG